MSSKSFDFSDDIAFATDRDYMRRRRSLIYAVCPLVFEEGSVADLISKLSDVSFLIRRHNLLKGCKDLTSETVDLLREALAIAEGHVRDAEA